MKLIKIIIYFIVVIYSKNLFSQGCSASLTWSNEDASNIGTGVTGITIHVSGILLIDADFTITDCDMMMAPGTIIYINADKKLILDNCHIYSCDGVEMWTGIQLYEESSEPISLEVTHGTVIEDAEIAIDVQDDNGIVVHDS